MGLQLFRPTRVMGSNEHTTVQTPSTEPSSSSEFTTFMRAYQDMVFSTAARLAGSDAQAEDIAQDVFIKAYENFEHLRTSPAAGGWLKTVARNLSLNYLTRYRKRWRLFSEESTVPEIALPDDLVADLSADQRRTSIDDALRRLPPHQRVPLVLYHFEDFSYQEIAQRLGISLAKVKTDIARARAAMLPMLKSQGIEGAGE
jgi:RNA polymerase sigma-70 factor, ECF subfamily